MKIIADTSKSPYNKKFLVEMSDDEWAQVSQSKVQPAIGQESDVNTAWRDLRKFREAKAEIEKAAETLKACANLAVAAAAVYVIAPEPIATE